MSTLTDSSSKLKVWKKDLPKHIFIILVLMLELFPFYMMLQISVKNNTIFNSNQWLPIPPTQWEWGNFVYGFNLILPSVANTVFVAVLGTVLTLCLAVFAAYFFARYRMPLSGFLWSSFLLVMLIPSVVNIVPLFVLLKNMNLLNTLWALIIVGIAGGQVFAVFILRNFIEDIPKDLFEAAEIDGANHFKQVTNIVVPMCAPIIGTLFILIFLGMWNDFLLPLVVLRDKELFTIGVNLIYLDGEYNKDFGKIMASFLVAALPLIVIFLFTMRLFIRGLSAGALKG